MVGHTLARQSGLVLARKISLEYLDILAWIRGFMMIVAYEAGRLEAVDKRILLGELPVERL